jgi:hypothetical protein
MKKSNMLIAVFAVLAAASVAKAENMEVNFDGQKGLQPQSMHSIFAAAHNIVPAGTLKADAETNKRLMGGSGDPCCDDPTILCYAPCEPEPEFVKAGNNASFKELARYYLAQQKIKSAVSEYYAAIGDTASAQAMADKDVRVAASNGSVFVIRTGSQERIADRSLAARVEAIVRPEGQQKIVMEGTAIIIGCMSSKDCWDAVGDGVSAVSEWLNS